MDISALLTGSDLSSGVLQTLGSVTSSGLTSGLGGMFSGSNLIASFIISTLGFSYFMYGKKNGYRVALVSGLLLMIFPYFVHDLTSMIGIAVFLCVFPFVIRR